MAEVFINYRTGDGDKTAALIDQELSRRFGKNCIFRASKSIAPGTAFPEALKVGIRRCSVLLAVIGPDWINFRTRLHDPEDWVRKEIEQAFEYETSVIPVLEGRKTSRLNRADLPEELARLADLQSIPFDTHDTETGLKRLGDVVAKLAPALHDLDREAASQPAPGSTENSIGDVQGPAVQSQNVTGDIGSTVVKDSHGPVHTGKGDIYQNSRHVSGGRHFTGDGMTYFEGDHHGDIRHRFGDTGRSEDNDQ
ncbi:toll/interleukin-1 receptor domain-containing protein [Streptomyces minutiscleroticus]|uniref:TIR domain-containing protein n=1 Tax=Streptomyces minutiscleroticus TaxID=68238 RepID=A0A918U834_9ACTN|nr:toll/interleukin-1 receptor domain-containing protein [Streptomyces minutiscleroticus]GGY07265.1 hypothetical protein GCM10010358_70480 [Streptomyces minutiscleroticus]